MRRERYKIELMAEEPHFNNIFLSYWRVKKFYSFEIERYLKFHVFIFAAVYD